MQHVITPILITVVSSLSDRCQTHINYPCMSNTCELFTNTMPDNPPSCFRLEHAIDYSIKNKLKK